jgi:hypothetical protein
LRSTFSLEKYFDNPLTTHGWKTEINIYNHIKRSVNQMSNLSTRKGDFKIILKYM